MGNENGLTTRMGNPAGPKRGDPVKRMCKVQVSKSKKRNGVQIGASGAADRIKNYKTYISKLGKSAFEKNLQARVASFKTPDSGQWTANFNRFIQMYNISSLPAGALDEEGRPQAHRISTTCSDVVFKYLESFAHTDYGSAVIYEMINNQNKYGKNWLQHGSLEFTRTAGEAMSFGSRFPVKRFDHSNQCVLPEAIIYHEFGHTVLFSDHSSGTHAPEEEAAIVRVLENPIRMRYNYEPRYTYTTDATGDLITINTLTNEKRVNKVMSVHKDKPYQLVEPTDANALSRHVLKFACPYR